MEPTRSRGVLRTSYIVREMAKSAATLVPRLMFLRKRLYSRENDPVDLVLSHHCNQWECHRAALAELGLSVSGMRIAELGPGPILANGIYFIANGAASYVGIDRYPVLRKDAEARRAYQELVRSMPEEQRARCEGLIGAEPGSPLFDERIRMVEAMAEDATALIGPETCDLVVSFNFMEHVEDPHRVLGSVGSMLKAGGLMLHRVDVSTHGPVRATHPLAQLTVTSRVWKLMRSRRALPNRLRPSGFLQAAQECGFETLLYKVTNRLSPDEVEAFRPSLCREMRSCSLDDLATLDFVWCARRRNADGAVR